MTEPCYLTPYLARFEERLSQRQQESLGDLKNAYRRYEGETLPSEEHLLILCAQFDSYLAQFPLGDLQNFLREKIEMATLLITSLKKFSESPSAISKRIDYLRLLAESERLQKKDLKQFSPYYSQILRLSDGNFDPASRTSFVDFYTFFLEQNLHRFQICLGRTMEQEHPLNAYRECIQTIQNLENEELPSDFIRSLYQKALDSLPPHHSPLYSNHDLNRISDELIQKVHHFTPVKVDHPLSSLERFWKALHTYREKFANAFEALEKDDLTAIRSFQKGRFEAFRTFFEEILCKSPFFIFEPPPPKPCQGLEVIRTSKGKYEICAVGSTGREEITPYSDLELFILTDTPSYKTHFEKVVSLLEESCSLFCEGSPPSLMGITSEDFTHQGLKFDRPNHTCVDSPQEMAQIQKQFEEEKVAHHLDLVSFLKPSSLQRGDRDLLSPYQNALSTTIDLKQRALHLLAFRLKSYQKKSYQKTSQNLKKDYLELFNHTLNDLSLYHHIVTPNTLDTIDALTASHEWTKETGTLLKKMVASLYLLRVKLHFHAKGASDEISFEPHLSEYVLTEKEKTLLNRLSQKILPTLYKKIEEGLKNPTISLLQELDLLEELFPLPTLNFQEEGKEYIEWLLLAEVSPQRHQTLYRSLSHPLRKIYLDTLNENDFKTLAHQLSLIPTSSGERHIRHFLEAHFHHHLLDITTPTLPFPKDAMIIEVTSPSFQEKRYLHPKVAEQIIDPQTHRIIRKETNSRHAVSPLNWNGIQLHFKDRPDHPGIEYAVYSLTSKIAPFAIPTTTLVKFTPPHKAPYPVLISKTIPGKTLEELFAQKESLQSLNQEQVSRLLIASLLTIPLDGRPSNYILKEETQEIFCIDNDASFGDPFNKERIFTSILFLLDEISHISPEASGEFLTLDPTLLVDGWLEELVIEQKNYEALFTPQETQKLWDATTTISQLLWNQEEPDPATPSILFPPGAITRLMLQFHELRTLFQTLPLHTPQDLLKTLISTRPDLAGKETIGHFIANRYQKAQSFPSHKKLQVAIDSKQTASLTSSQTTKARLGAFQKGSIETLKKNYSLAQSIEEFFALQIKEPTKKEGRTSLITVGEEKAIEADFKTIEQEERQMIILKAFHYILQQIKKQKEKMPQKIFLQHCRALKQNDNLLPFLHPDLKVLDLTASHLGEGALLLIEETCPHLEELYLSGSSFRNFQKYSGFFNTTPKPLSFPYLKILHMSRCKELQTLSIHAPLLETLKLSHNSSLQTLELHFTFPKIHLKNTPQVKTTYPGVFGKDQWEKYFGVIGEVPPLPPNIGEILNRQCIFWPDKKVHETHLLVFIPETVNGKPFHLDYLSELIQSPKSGPKTKYDYYFDNTKKELGTKSLEPHWVLMTKDVIPESRNKSYEDQKARVQKKAEESGIPYELPKALEAATVILMHHVETGQRIYSDSPWTYTRCQEKVNNNQWPQAIGGFAAGGLVIGSYLVDRVYCGCGGVWNVPLRHIGH
jgi:hypothetical protein